jgi:hypothetical protein
VLDRGILLVALDARWAHAGARPRCHGEVQIGRRRRIERAHRREVAARRLDRLRPLHPLRDVAVAGLQVHPAAQRMELLAQLGRGRVPLAWITRERLQHDRVELGRARLVERGRRHDVAALQLEQRLVLVLAREQGARREQLVRDHAGREQIAARVEVLAGDRLRRHVRELPLHATRLRAELRRLRLRDAEVDHLEEPGPGDEQVRRRHVAVDEPERVAVLVDLRVRVLERVA